MPTLPLDTHTSILGVTSSGKTYAAKWAFRRSRRINLFLNLQAEEVPATVHTTDAPTMTQLLVGEKVVWTPSDHRTAARDLEPLIARLFTMGEAIGDKAGGISINRAQPWLNLWADEAHLVAPNAGSPGPLERVATQGLRYGIVLATISQRPQLLSKTVLSQSPQVLLYKVTQPDREYLEAKLAPIGGNDWAWLQQPYHFLRLGPDGWQRHRPL